MYSKLPGLRVLGLGFRARLKVGSLLGRSVDLVSLLSNLGYRAYSRD